MEKEIRIDALAFSPHPDDAEMGCGGLLLKLKDKGYRTGIIDLTRAELSTNGNLKTREEEIKEASKILGLDIRENLGLEDANIKNDYDSRLKVISVIRKYRPELALIPFWRDRHPDHENSYKLLKDAIFISGLKKFKTGLDSYRPDVVINYMLHYEFKPSFIVDISKYYNKKFSAVAAYKSQFYSDVAKKVMTHIASKYFFDIINSRHQCSGLKIRSEYGEPYYIESDIKIDDPLEFFKYLK
ncbi:MAG: bacillithiol biosynthesis deacetylase BshB1 [Actinobacteria bacterium]|nr:bacillithiol biosynthesis deacetylase BshB1 [Chloroflexota bacterium]MBE3128591.1 bacillithiol biosynthesis deacetylase BshB1 [Actinomycetota bacterium]